MINAEEALQLSLTSEEISMEHLINFKGVNVCAATVDDETNDDMTGLQVPSMPRLLAIVENIAPIPVTNRVARVELVSSSITNLTVTRELIVGVLRNLVVPYMDYQKDEAFYMDNYDQVDSNKLLSAQDKKDRNDKLRELEAVMSLDKILKLRSRSTGLAKYYRRD
ncbi:unnamed protein product [Peronospora belbahrii]|uniref:Uncharacterized protein n=1 Tax=Peronospora belbahrii TaxID=622444 RepID=A0ABN8D3N0_9STRA|nr:unnamed protein product [Peronospora belbahrii]